MCYNNYGGFMNYVFVVNPVAGNGKTIEIIGTLKKYCKLFKINYNILYTNTKSNYLIEKYVNRKNTTIFCVGGDGTLNLLVNLLAKKGANLGIIPSGTGNDFYKTFKEFKGDKIDLGKVNDRYFINVASIGLDAEIANYANKLKKEAKNKNVYIKSLIHEYLNFKPIDLNINNKEQKSTILTVCNAKYYGGGFQISPQSKLNDGMFDIIDVKSLKKLEILYLISKLVQGTHLNDKKVNSYKTDSITISSNSILNCNIDGEIIKDNKFEFSLDHNSLNVDVNNSNRITEFLKIKQILK